MDSEWDRKVARVILGDTHSLQELDSLGIDSNTIDIVTDQELEISNECENAHTAAKDMVLLNINEQINRVEIDVANKRTLIEKKEGDWPEERLLDLQEKMDKENEHIKYLKDLVSPSTKKQNHGFKVKCKRKAENLMEINRLKRRRLTNQGL